MLEYEFNYEAEQSMSDDVWGFDNQYPKYINYSYDEYDHQYEYEYKEE